VNIWLERRGMSLRITYMEQENEVELLDQDRDQTLAEHDCCFERGKGLFFWKVKRMRWLGNLGSFAPYGVYSIVRVAWNSISKYKKHKKKIGVYSTSHVARHLFSKYKNYKKCFWCRLSRTQCMILIFKKCKNMKRKISKINKIKSTIRKIFMKNYMIPDSGSPPKIK